MAQAFIRESQKATEETAVLFFDNYERDGDTFSADIMVDPGGQPINAVGFTVNFNNSMVAVKNIEITNSFCELFIINEFDNFEQGEINIACGKPYPGIEKTSLIARVDFLVSGNGWSDLEFDENAMVLANDGYGTNVISELKNISIKF